MNINLKWSRKGINSMAEKINRDGECAELPALICLDMIVMLQAEVERLADQSEKYRLEMIRYGKGWEDEISKGKSIRDNGAKLANCAFNLAQKTGETLTSDDTTILDQLRKEWDAALMFNI